MAREVQWTGEIIPNGGLNDAVSPTSDEVLPNQWTAASNVEPLVDGARRRRGSAAASDTPTQKVVAKFDLGTNTREFVDGSSEYIAESFEPSEEIYVDQVAVRLLASSGTPTGEVELGIFTDNSGEPSTTAVQHGAFADYDTATAEEIQSADTKQITGGTWFVFKSSAGKATLAADTTYWIVCRHTDAAATGTSNISIEEKTASTGTAPINIPSGNPSIWLDPDDIEDATGVSDNANTGSATLPEHTGLHPGGFAPTGGDGVVLHTATGALPVNGHAWVEQPATACTNALSQGGSVLSSYTFSSNFTALMVYRPRGPADTNASIMIGRRGGSSSENGIGCPIKNAAGRGYISTDSLADQSTSGSQDTNDTDVKIMIATRSSGVISFYGTLADDTAESFGTITTSESLEFDALLRWDGNSDSEAGLGIVQIVVYNFALSTDERNELYAWAQNRFGLTHFNETVGEVAYSTDGSTWNSVAAADLNYRVYSGVGEMTAICDYQKSDGTQRHIITADENIYKNVDGVVSLVDGQMLRGIRREEVGGRDPDVQYPSWSNGGDRLFLTDYTTESRKFYVDDDGVERVEIEGLFKPAVTPTLGEAVAGGLLDGTYYVDYHFYNYRTGARSNPMDSGIGTASFTQILDIETDDNTLTVDDLPTGPTLGTLGESATHIRIMVKEPGSSIYRLAKEIPIGTTSASITSDDKPFTIEDEYNHNPPPVHAVRIYAENRNFIADLRGTSGEAGTAAGNLGLPWRLQWSAINGITPYIESYPTLQYRDFDKSDRITALAFMPPRTLIVGMTRSVVAIDARRPGTSDVLQLTSTVGVAHHRSIIVIDSVLYWLSDNPRGFYKWEPGMREPERMRGADKVLSTLDQTRFTLASTARLPEDKDRSQWWTLLSSDSASTHDTLLVHDRAMNPPMGSWTVFEKPAGREGSIIGTVLESGTTKMYLGGVDGIEREQDTGDTDDGTEFTGSVSLKAFDFQQQGATKRFRGIQTIVEGSDDSDLTLAVERDLGNLPTQTAEMDPSPSGGDRIVKTHERTRGLVLRPTYSGKKPWRIKDVSMNIQPTKRT